jgi:hypothetical protein
MELLTLLQNGPGSVIETLTGEACVTVTVTLLLLAVGVETHAKFDVIVAETTSLVESWEAGV